jgi:tRNA threonylcarbamoyladenosine biosynthesis protein TsaB
MPTLRDLAGQHGPLLVLDASSSAAQAGWWPSAGEPTWSRISGEAGIALFQALEALAISPTEAGAYVYCDGPGSILGVRTSAMAVRAWSVLAPKPVFAYHSLSVVAASLGNSRAHVIADARRDTWHCALADGSIARIASAQLPESVVMPEGFRVWSQLPRPVPTVPYSLAALLPRVADADLFHPVAAPDAFLHEEPSYAKWTPQIHRAP